MKIILLSVITLLVMFSGCRQVGTPKQKQYIEDKTTLYTQRTIWIKNKKGKISRDPSQSFFVSEPFLKNSFVLPVNSKVIVEGFKSNLVLSHRGRRIYFKGLKVADKDGKYTNEAKQKFFDETLKSSPVNLSKFSQMEQDNILINEVSEGMSKKAVETSIGKGMFPMTFSYSDDRWYYGNMLLVIFKDNKAIKIKDNRVLKTQEVEEGPFK